MQDSLGFSVLIAFLFIAGSLGVLLSHNAAMNGNVDARFGCRLAFATFSCSILLAVFISSAPAWAVWFGIVLIVSLAFAIRPALYGEPAK